ncbi:hypothetical protein TSOC_008683 [Tetrabaena socialis]|uniref:Uncharacterized protein n=1 Tax=Tetrabaena socialis TaxID=47790 RepID=A0A2J7ZXW2_9CHLO|nr:hypothetical protein TSOC_008683 [Tetrabaena socialis]|eukprot:PNH05092.1 hypothetical protein TSOC_008683 [Tetrabaena socialis]
MAEPQPSSGSTSSALASQRQHWPTPRPTAVQAQETEAAAEEVAEGRGGGTGFSGAAAPQALPYGSRAAVLAAALGTVSSHAPAPPDSPLLMVRGLHPHTPAPAPDPSGGAGSGAGGSGDGGGGGRSWVLSSPASPTGPFTAAARPPAASLLQTATPAQRAAAAAAAALYDDSEDAPYGAAEDGPHAQHQHPHPHAQHQHQHRHQFSDAPSAPQPASPDLGPDRPYLSPARPRSASVSGRPQSAARPHSAATADGCGSGGGRTSVSGRVSVSGRTSACGGAGFLGAAGFRGRTSSSGGMRPASATALPPSPERVSAVPAATAAAAVVHAFEILPDCSALGGAGAGAAGGRVGRTMAGILPAGNPGTFSVPLQERIKMAKPFSLFINGICALG